MKGSRWREVPAQAGRGRGRRVRPRRPRPDSPTRSRQLDLFRDTVDGDILLSLAGLEHAALAVAGRGRVRDVIGELCALCEALDDERAAGQPLLLGGLRCGEAATCG